MGKNTKALARKVTLPDGDTPRQFWQPRELGPYKMAVETLVRMGDHERAAGLRTQLYEALMRSVVNAPDLTVAKKFARLGCKLATIEIRW